MKNIYTHQSKPRWGVAWLTFFSIVFGSACLASASHKTDAELEKSFLQNREDYNRLAKLVEEDKDLWRVSADTLGFGWKFEVNARDEKNSTRLANNEEISQARRKEYARLLKKLGLIGLTQSKIPEGTGIFFASTVRQTDATDSDTKGFAYIIGGKPASVRNSLDEFNDNARTSGDPAPEYKILKDNWYLFFRLS